MCEVRLRKRWREKSISSPRGPCAKLPPTTSCRASANPRSILNSLLTYNIHCRILLSTTFGCFISPQRHIVSRRSKGALVVRLMFSHHRMPRAAQTRRQNVPSTSAANRMGRDGRSTMLLGSIRPTVLLLAKALLVPLASAAPLSSLWTRDVSAFAGEPEPIPPDDPNLWVYLGIAMTLVLLGGAFAGLTIALMGQDETYLQVLAASGEGSEKKSAEKVLTLLNRGKHWVLVTLLLSNVITNETLPIVLDRSLGGGWPAVLGSTVLIGEKERPRYSFNCVLTMISYLRRDRTTEYMRTIWTRHRCIHGAARALPYVAHVSSCLAHRQAAGLPPWQGPRNNV